MRKPLMHAALAGWRELALAQHPPAKDKAGLLARSLGAVHHSAIVQRHRVVQLHIVARRGHSRGCVGAGCGWPRQQATGLLRPPASRWLVGWLCPRSWRGLEAARCGGPAEESRRRGPAAGAGELSTIGRHVMP